LQLSRQVLFAAARPIRRQGSNIGGNHAAPDHRHRSFGVRPVDAWLQASEDVQPVRVLPVQDVGIRPHCAHHGDRHENGGILARADRLESGLSDSYNGQRLSVHDQALVQNIGLSAEPPHPVAMAQNDDGSAAGGARILFLDQTA
jgi:hypothetical protein